MSYPYQQYPPEGYQGHPNPRYQQQMPSFDVHLSQPGPSLPQQYLQHGAYIDTNQYQYAPMPSTYNLHAPPPLAAHPRLPQQAQQSYPPMYFQPEYRPHIAQNLPAPTPRPMPYSMPQPTPTPTPETTKPAISSSHLSDMRTAEKPKVEPLEDQSQVLLGLSEEYHNAAKKISPMRGDDRASEIRDRYYEFMSLCIGCLETAINVSTSTYCGQARF